MYITLPDVYCSFANKRCHSGQASLIKLSAAFTRISSKILYKAGTYSMLRHTIRSFSKTYMSW